MVVQVTGTEKVLHAVDWLKRKRWQYELDYDQTFPFSTKFYFKINDPAKAFIFKLTWA